MPNPLSTSELIHQLEISGDRATMELVKAIIASGHEAVPNLCKILKDRSYWEASGDRGWMPLHAVISSTFEKNKCILSFSLFYP